MRRRWRRTRRKEYPPYVSLLPKWLRQANARSTEFPPGIVSGWQQPKYLEHLIKLSRCMRKDLDWKKTN